MASEPFGQTTFAELISEGTLEIGDGYRAKNEELGGDGLIFLRAGHVSDTHIDFAGVERFHSELEPRVRSKIAQPGDAIVTTKGNSTGRTAYVSSSMPPFVYSPHLSYWRSRNTSRVEGGYLRYWSKGQEFTEQLAGMKASTDMAPYLSLIDQKRLRISLPTIAEQRAIAHILGALDDKIELNRRMSATLEAMARALFKSWFVDFDPVRAKAEGRNPGLPAELAAFFPDRLVETEHGEVPQGWDVKPLSEIADFLNGLALQKYPASDPVDSLPVIKIAELRSGVSAKTDRASREVPGKYVVRDGDFLFSWSGSLLAKFWTEGEGALNQHLFKVTSDRYPVWFFAEWVQVHLEEFQRIAAFKATTMGHIQRSHLQAAMTNCPPDHAIAGLEPKIAPLIDRTTQNDLESRTLADLRDALLPRLISGDLRVKDAETFLDRVL